MQKNHTGSGENAPCVLILLDLGVAQDQEGVEWMLNKNNELRIHAKGFSENVYPFLSKSYIFDAVKSMLSYSLDKSELDFLEDMKVQNELFSHAELWEELHM